MMTGEEAIEELKKGVPQQWDWHRDRKAFKEAIEMGIEALELMGNPDTISREKMRRTIVDDTKFDTSKDYVRVLDAIESVPSYNLYRKWGGRMEFPAHEEMAKSVAEIALDSFEYQGKTIREWMKIIAEQELCEDAISRQAVLDTTICEGISCNECSFNTCEDGQPGCLLKERVKKLPPVTPQQKMGRWIEIAQYSDAKHKIECSECGNHIYDRGHANSFNVKNKYKYCPNCGAKMESEESDDIEAMLEHLWNATEEDHRKYSEVEE